MLGGADPVGVDRLDVIRVRLTTPAKQELLGRSLALCDDIVRSRFASFGEPPVRLSVAITSYLFALAVFIPISGWVADRFGARRVFRLAICVFVLGSILCGFTTSVWQLVLARTLQGLGGAMMVPVGRLVVLRNTSKSELMRAIAVLTWPALSAPILGPPLGVSAEHNHGINDLLDFLAAWGPNPGHPADFDGNGDVNIVDLLKLLASWGPCPP